VGLVSRQRAWFSVSAEGQVRYKLSLQTDLGIDRLAERQWRKDPAKLQARAEALFQGIHNRDGKQ